MLLALREARRAEGRSHPNPAVGALVFRGDRILGRGHTRPVGGPHAEVVALERARRRFGARALRGASLAVTLEPCSHQGRTGPCVDAILAASIGHVLVGHRDPHAVVAGRGLRRLRAGGVRVEVGALEEACRYQHRGFLSAVTRGRPFVALKLAVTLDGRIATRRGESRWITGPRARAVVHRLRDRADAVVVGSGTARADDPALTVRRGGRVVRVPVRVLVDSRLAVPATAQLFADGAAERTWVLTAPSATARRRREREALGARVLAVPLRGARLDLRRALRLLAREGLTSLLVEGGGALAAALLREDLVDEVHWLAAPALLGGDARPAVAALGVERLAGRIALQVWKVKRLGPDVYVHALVARPGRPR
jgi:diaminohydroxyphosphoribosylaminopyrimidine deaminase / 5-amino-6-(5-phosphoribosylamino)uracil reductase